MRLVMKKQEAKQDANAMGTPIAGRVQTELKDAFVVLTNDQ